MFEINKQVAKLEVGLDNVEKRLGKVETKLDQLHADMASLKSSIDVIKPIAKSVAKGVWAIAILLVTFGLSVLGVWIKHKMGW